MPTSLEESEKVRIGKNYANTFHLVKKIVKIGPVDPVIIWFKLKKKLTHAKYVARLASLGAGCSLPAID